MVANSGPRDKKWLKPLVFREESPFQAFLGAGFRPSAEGTVDKILLSKKSDTRKARGSSDFSVLYFCQGPAQKIIEIKGPP